MNLIWSSYTKKQKRVACLHIHQALSSTIKKENKEKKKEKKRKEALPNNRYQIYCDLLYGASLLQACGCEADIFTLTCLW